MQGKKLNSYEALRILCLKSKVYPVDLTGRDAECTNGQTIEGRVGQVSWEQRGSMETVWDKQPYTEIRIPSDIGLTWTSGETWSTSPRKK